MSEVVAAIASSETLLPVTPAELVIFDRGLLYLGTSLFVVDHTEWRSYGVHRLPVPAPVYDGIVGVYLSPLTMRMSLSLLATPTFAAVRLVGRDALARSLLLMPRGLWPTFQNVSMHRHRHDAEHSRVTAEVLGAILATRAEV